MHLCWSPRKQETLDPLELDLHVFVGRPEWALAAARGPPEGQCMRFNHPAISSALIYFKILFVFIFDDTVVTNLVLQYKSMLLITVAVRSRLQAPGQ